MGSLSATHWLLIALAFILLFGAKRLPDAARGLGRSLRIFKSEIQEMQSEPPKSAQELPSVRHTNPVQQANQDLDKT